LLNGVVAGEEERFCVHLLRVAFRNQVRTQDGREESSVRNARRACPELKIVRAPLLAIPMGLWSVLG
jgi:hypothetical protein